MPTPSRRLNPFVESRHAAPVVAAARARASGSRVLTNGSGFFVAVFACSLACATSADLLETRGEVDAVTVFRGQALVSRGVDLPGPVGLREVIVTELPEFILPASLYAESSDGLEVRTVSYRMRPLAEDARENVRVLDQRLREVGDKIDGNRSQQAFIDWQRQYLDKLENFLTVTVQVENGRGVLNAETVAKMTELISTQRLKQSEMGRALALELRALNEQRTLLQRERETISLRTSRSAREAVVFVNQTAPNARLRLNYLVDRASWSPSYNLRSEGAAAQGAPKDAVTIEYLASIQQMSGEDWTNVKLTLSTATPALVSSPPTLGPLAIALTAKPGSGGPGGPGDPTSGTYADAKRELARRQSEVESNRNMMNAPVIAGQTLDKADGDHPVGDPQQAGFNAQVFALGDNRADQSLNEVAAESQLLDVLSKEKIVRKERGSKTAEPQPSEESVSVTYAVASRTSVPSRTDQQLIQIARMRTPADFYKVATPVLTSAIFDEAFVTNESEMVLLAGPSASYSGGEFVGRGMVPTVAVGQSFTAGFGIDTSLRATRDLVERSESTQGGNRVVDFTYRISIENFSKHAVPLRLLDRLPNPQGQDIKLTLVSSGDETQRLSTDPAYERLQRKNGILRWDLTIPADRGAAEPYTLEYRFQIEYDRQMSVIQR